MDALKREALDLDSLCPGQTFSDPTGPDPFRAEFPGAARRAKRLERRAGGRLGRGLCRSSSFEKV